MKLSKQELKQRISDSITDNEELVISLLEDIEDSMVETNETVIDETKTKEIEDLKWKYENLQAKYKERFLKGEETEKETKDETDNPEMEEKAVIDIKEI